MASDKSETWRPCKGLINNARSPGSITNAQHHDNSLSERNIVGSPGTPDQIISDATNEQPVPDGSVIRVMNTTNMTQFLFIGKESDVPSGDPDIADGIAIAPNFYENFYIGKLVEDESIFIKTSDDDLQIVVFNP